MMIEPPYRVATPDQLSPEARKLYEGSVEELGEERSRLWLEYRDHYILDADLNAVPVPFAEWAIFHESADRIIRRETLGNWIISTVFLGLDHGFRWPQDNPDYKPVLWETMIFHEPTAQHNRRHWRRRKFHAKTGRISGPKYRPAPFPDQEQWRYTSTPDAVEGHARAVQLVQLVRSGPRKFKKWARRRKGRRQERRWSRVIDRLTV